MSKLLMLEMEKSRLKEMIILLKTKSEVVRNYNHCSVCLLSKQVYKKYEEPTPCHYCRSLGIENRCNTLGRALYDNLGSLVWNDVWKDGEWQGFGYFKLHEDYKLVYMIKLKEFLKLVEEEIKNE